MKPLLRALGGEIVTPPPVWLMRQAGRFLPEYQEVRAKAGGFLNLVYSPELAAEVTLQPVKRFGMDAAILFSDILIVPQMLGQQLEFAEGEGPKLGPLEIDKLKKEGFEEHAKPVWETVRRVKEQLPENCALIGFAGSPWTVACYMIEGGGSDTFDNARQFARSRPADFEKLIDRIITATLVYLEGQIEAGAEVIQLFDSWAGKCDNFQRWVIEPTAALVMILKSKYPKIPIIGFPRLASQQHMASYGVYTGVNCVGLDQSIDLDWATQSLARRTTLQGNLDPELLIRGGDEMRAGVDKILQHAKQRPWIFNLGHGVDKTTPPEHVAELIAQIRAG